MKKYKFWVSYSSYIRETSNRTPIYTISVDPVEHLEQTEQQRHQGSTRHNQFWRHRHRRSSALELRNYAVSAGTLHLTLLSRRINVFRICTADDITSGIEFAYDEPPTGFAIVAVTAILPSTANLRTRLPDKLREVAGRRLIARRSVVIVRSFIAPCSHRGRRVGIRGGNVLAIA